MWAEDRLYEVTKHWAKDRLVNAVCSAILGRGTAATES